MGIKPEALVNRPELAERWHIPYRVWKEVDGSRNYTPAGLAEIPFSEFFLWAIAYKYTLTELTSMWEDVHRIDVAWLLEHGKRQEAKQKAAKQQQPTPKIQR